MVIDNPIVFLTACITHGVHPQTGKLSKHEISLEKLS